VFASKESYGNLGANAEPRIISVRGSWGRFNGDKKSLVLPINSFNEQQRRENQVIDISRFLF
jgi:hypothetical protein